MGKDNDKQDDAPQYTPAPWVIKLDKQAAKIWIIAERKSKPGIVCRVAHDKDNPPSLGEFTANAFLVATAPELLQGCKDAKGDIERLIATIPDCKARRDAEEHLENINKALAKADLPPAPDLEDEEEG